MEIISYLNKEKWNAIVKSFKDWDIYYLCEYAISLMYHGDGEPLLISYEDDRSRLCYVVMMSDIADIIGFNGTLPKNMYFDIMTPYGYGGPLVEGNFDKESRARFINEMQEHCNQKKIITQFIRFHPLYQNHKWVEGVCEILSPKETITIDTTTIESINRNMESKNRNMVRKAVKLGVTIVQDKGEHLDDFVRIYEATMDNNKAEDYYYFERKYYDYLIEEMKENVVFFYAYLGGIIVSASMFFYNKQYMHYHLSGTLREYRHTAAANLLIYEAACWGAQKGVKNLHLGGGKSAVDGLLGFKKQFNKNGHLPFYVGRTIYIEEKYKELLQRRKALDQNFNENNSFLIQYGK